MNPRMIIAALALLAAPASAADFNGPRVQVQGGWDRPSYGQGVDDIFDQNRSGVNYGFGVGYDFALGSNLVLGVEANIDWTTADLEVTDGNNVAGIDLGRDISTVARLGFKAGDKALVYALGGYTNLGVTGTARVGGTTILNETGNGDGFRLGAGVEVAVTDQLFGKLEYRYSNYSGDVSRNQVLVGAGFRF